VNSASLGLSTLGDAQVVALRYCESVFGNHGNLDIDWLSSVGVFKAFSNEELEQVAELGERVEAEPGAVLTDQGRFGDTAYLIVEGTANVYMNGEYVTNVAAETLVGEMALIEHRPRNATVVAESQMVLVGFGIPEFHTLLEKNPSARESVMALLGHRLQENDARRGG
jgi:CRP/FNR family cyclic AMP-dependent transcriptional regulator